MNNMTPQQFIDLVCRMRSAQKQYFRTRRHADLEESVKLEKEVDNALRSFSQEEELPLFIQHFDPS